MQTQHLNDNDEYLQFGAKSNPSGQADPVVEVIWQPTPLAVEQLAQAKATEAHLLIVTESNGREIDRMVVPLESGRWFVPLGTPGLNHIHATIVWGDVPKDRSAKRILLAKTSRREYELDVLQEHQPAVIALQGKIRTISREMNESNISDEQFNDLSEQLSKLNLEMGEAYNQDYETIIRSELYSTYADRKNFHSLGRTKLAVVIPEEMFAQSWSITEKLGNLFFVKARDQCQLRRRAIITGLTAPIWIAIGIVVFAVVIAAYYFVGAVIVLSLWLWGSRNLDYNYFKMNLDNRVRDIFADIKPSRWWTKEVVTESSSGYKTTSYPARHSIFYFFNPVTLAGVALIVVIQLYFGVEGRSLSYPFLIMAAIALVLAIVAITISRREEELTSEPTPEVARQIVIRQYSPTVIQQAKRTPTLHLRYLETKAKFCKPFARKA